MRDLHICSVAAIAAASIVGSASAGTVTFTYSDTAGLAASGSLTVTNLGGGIYQATAGLMSITAAPALPSMVGSYPLIFNPSTSPWNSPSGAFIVDNLLYIPAVGGPGGLLDNWGLLFGTGGTQEVNIWGNGPNSPYTGYRWTGGVGYDYTNDTGTFSAELVSTIPLPTGAAIGLAGLGMVGANRRRRAGV